MKETFHDELEVGQRDRISIDISDIREQIEQCRDDMAWSELPLAAKIRVLVKERLAQMEASMDQEGSNSSTISLPPATNNDDYRELNS